MSILPFHVRLARTMAREDSLVVLGHGLGEAELVSAYVQQNATRDRLVILLGVDADLFDFVQEQLYHGPACSQDEPPVFHYVTANYNAAARGVIYANGGGVCVTTRILLVDILNGVVPVEAVRQLLFINAHQVDQTHPYGFVVALMRSGNASCVFSGICGRPEVLTRGFFSMELVMRLLQLTRVHLCDRRSVEGDLNTVAVTHTSAMVDAKGCVKDAGDVKSSEGTSPNNIPKECPKCKGACTCRTAPAVSNRGAPRTQKMTVTEMRVSFTPLMRAIQSTAALLISELLQTFLSANHRHLRSARTQLMRRAGPPRPRVGDTSAADNELDDGLSITKALSLSRVLSARFGEFLRPLLTTAASQVTRFSWSHYRDIHKLRKALELLCVSDAVYFFRWLCTLRRKGNHVKSQWMFCDKANRLFKAAQRRIYRFTDPHEQLAKWRAHATATARAQLEKVRAQENAQSGTTASFGSILPKGVALPAGAPYSSLQACAQASIHIKIEAPPKMLALLRTLQTIRKESHQHACSLSHRECPGAAPASSDTSASCHGVPDVAGSCRGGRTVLVVCRNPRSAEQIRCCLLQQFRDIQRRERRLQLSASAQSNQNSTSTRTGVAANTTDSTPITSRTNPATSLAQGPCPRTAESKSHRDEQLGTSTDPVTLVQEIGEAHFRRFIGMSEQHHPLSVQFGTPSASVARGGATPGGGSRPSGPSSHTPSWISFRSPEFTQAWWLWRRWYDRLAAPQRQSVLLRTRVLGLGRGAGRDSLSREPLSGEDGDQTILLSSSSDDDQELVEDPPEDGDGGSQGDGDPRYDGDHLPRDKGTRALVHSTDTGTLTRKAAPRSKRTRRSRTLEVLSQIEDIGSQQPSGGSTSATQTQTSGDAHMLADEADQTQSGVERVISLYDLPIGKMDVEIVEVGTTNDGAVANKDSASFTGVVGADVSGGVSCVGMGDQDEKPQSTGIAARWQDPSLFMPITSYSTKTTEASRDDETTRVSGQIADQKKQLVDAAGSSDLPQSVHSQGQESSAGSSNTQNRQDAGEQKQDTQHRDDSTPETSVMMGTQWRVVVLCLETGSSSRSNRVHGITLSRALSRYRPHNVIMYESSLVAVRTVERFANVHAPLCPAPAVHIHVHLMLYRDSVEEHRYLDQLRVENQAFAQLTRQMRHLVVMERRPAEPSNARPRKKRMLGLAPGGAGSHVSTARMVGYDDGEGVVPRALMAYAACLPAAEAQAKLGVSSSTVATPGLPAGPDWHKWRPVIVDVREFRSALPFFLHKQGMRVVPVTLTVGDYVLSPLFALERKGIADLISSLISGRLFRQLRTLTRCYRLPAVLIEFDPKKPFGMFRQVSFKDRMQTPVDPSTTRSQDGVAYHLGPSGHSAMLIRKLILLVKAYPQVRWVWSAGPQATASMLATLCQSHKYPSVETARLCGTGRNHTGVDARLSFDGAQEIVQQTEVEPTKDDKSPLETKSDDKSRLETKSSTAAQSTISSDSTATDEPGGGSETRSAGEVGVNSSHAADVTADATLQSASKSSTEVVTGTDGSNATADPGGQVSFTAVTTLAATTTTTGSAVVKTMPEQHSHSVLFGVEQSDCKYVTRKSTVISDQASSSCAEEILRLLPGVGDRHARLLMQHCACLADIAQLSAEELTLIFRGRDPMEASSTRVTVSSVAKVLYSFLHFSEQ